MGKSNIFFTKTQQEFGKGQGNKPASALDTILTDTREEKEHE